MTTFLLAFFSLLLSILKLSAAGPITHVYFAHQWLEKYPVENNREFIVGNLFPDIRHLGCSSREETHITEPSIDKILNSKTSFQSGVALHSFLDKIREQFIEKNGIYDEIAIYTTEFRVMFLKLLEDEILYDRVPILSTIQDLDPICEEEKTIDGITESELLKWHDILQLYFSLLPSEGVRFLSLKPDHMLKDHPSPSILREWGHLLPELAEDPRWIQYVEDMIVFINASFG